MCPTLSLWLNYHIENVQLSHSGSILVAHVLHSRILARFQTKSENFMKCIEFKQNLQILPNTLNSSIIYKFNRNAQNSNKIHKLLMKCMECIEFKQNLQIVKKNQCNSTKICKFYQNALIQTKSASSTNMHGIQATSTNSTQMHEIHTPNICKFYENVLNSNKICQFY
jgi:hypothetical protein